MVTWFVNCLSILKSTGSNRLTKLSFLPVLFLFITAVSNSQTIDTAGYRFDVETPAATKNFFSKDSFWRGADGASSVDLGNGKVLWLFSDGFVCSDSSRLRSKSKIIRNSIAIQNGYDPTTASVKYYWRGSKENPEAFFHNNSDHWYWTGHGVMIKDRLLVFLMKVKKVNRGLGFEVVGWDAALISNPLDDPLTWKVNYIEGQETFSAIVGSAAVLKDQAYMYAYSAVEPATHEVYLLRWGIEDAWNGRLQKPEWWINDRWIQRNSRYPVPTPLFIGQTEFSVHFDTALKKYIQVQSVGFGKANIAVRFSEHMQGPWTDLQTIYMPAYTGVKQPLAYAAKAHPALNGNGIYITWNVNSSDFKELIENQSIYFPRFILVGIKKN